MKQKLLFIMVWILYFTTSPSFGYQATFTPRISVSEEYTDNYNQTDKNKEDEYITRITPGFTIQLPGRNIGADLSYDFGYTMYGRNSEENYRQHSARFAGWSNLGRNTRLDLTDSFVYTKEPNIQDDIATIRTTTPDIPIDSTIRRGREAYYTNSTGLKLKHQFGRFGRASSIRLGYIYRFLNNDDPTYEDNKNCEYSTGLTYWFSPQWGFDANAYFKRYEYDLSEDRDLLSGDVRVNKKYTPNFQAYIRYSQTNINYDESAEDDNTYSPSIGFDYSFLYDTSLSLDIGYFIYDPEYGDDESGLTMNGRLVKPFRRGYRTGSLNLSVLSGYDYSLSGAETLGFEKFYEVAGSATYQLTRLLSGFVFASYRHSKYPEIIPERTDKTTNAGIGLGMRPKPWVSFGLNYNYRIVDSDVRENEYDENRIIINITLSSPRPYRSGHY